MRSYRRPLLGVVAVEAGAGTPATLFDDGFEAK